MPRTPDRAHGPLQEDEEIQLEANASPPSIAGAFNFNGSVFQMKDGLGIFDPRASSGITAGGHQILDQLVHNIAETGYEEITRSGGQVVSDIIWTDNTKVRKIRETLITRSGGQVDTMVEKQYDATGALVQTLTGTITRVSGQVDKIDWVLT